MRAKASTIWYVDTPDPMGALQAGVEPDAGAAAALAKQLFADCDTVPTTSGPLAVNAGPGSGEVFIGCYPGLTVLCASRLALPRLSRLTEDYIRPLASEQTYLVGLQPALGWGGFAHWERGLLRRSFSATRVNILENEGLPLVWERPFWAGEYPIMADEDNTRDPQRLPFDPLRFADEANLEWLGFHYSDEDDPIARQLDVCGFALYPPGEAPEQPRPALSETDRATGRSFRRWLRRRGEQRVN